MRWEPPPGHQPFPAPGLGVLRGDATDDFLDPGGLGPSCGAGVMHGADLPHRAGVPHGAGVPDGASVLASRAQFFVVSCGRARHEQGEAGRHRHSQRRGARKRQQP
jgi:hypothetical protein